MPKATSIALVVASFVLVLMPFVGALSSGDNQAAAATGDTLGVPPVAHQPGLADSGRADELSMPAAGDLPGRGGALRRAA